jgi:hypothetical protein
MDTLVLACDAATVEEDLFTRLEERRDLHGEANTMQVRRIG